MLKTKVLLYTGAVVRVNGINPDSGNLQVSDGVSSFETSPLNVVQENVSETIHPAPKKVPQFNLNIVSAPGLNATEFERALRAEALEKDEHHLILPKFPEIVSDEESLTSGNYSGETAEEQPENSGQKSLRFNKGKIQCQEVDPLFILGIGEVLTKSRAKYEHFNWQKDTPFSTPYDSLMRHLMAFQMGEEVDPETGCHHLLHAASNLMFLHYHATNHPESDDRGFKKVKK